MNTFAKLFTLLLLAGVLRPAAADIHVFACEPEWGALTRELAGDKADVYTATNPFQDPHHIQARPSLISRLRRADLAVCTGAQLEIGWMPQLLLQSGNDRIQKGRPGHFEAASHVKLLEVPESVNRALGDVHPDGNPHIQSDPRNIGAAAAALTARLELIDPANSGYYAARGADFLKRWNAAIARWTEEAKPLRGVRVVVHHDGWAYLFNWLGIDKAGALEPKPGVPPSAGHLAELKEELAGNPARMVIRAAYQDDRADHWLSAQTGIPAVELPFTVGGTPAASDLFGLYQDTIARMLQALKQ
jgi:zinc/manganese transport system substrate-binding protein